MFLRFLFYAVSQTAGEFLMEEGWIYTVIWMVDDIHASSRRNFVRKYYCDALDRFQVKLFFGVSHYGAGRGDLEDDVILLRREDSSCEKIGCWQTMNLLWLLFVSDDSKKHKRVVDGVFTMDDDSVVSFGALRRALEPSRRENFWVAGFPLHPFWWSPQKAFRIKTRSVADKGIAREFPLESSTACAFQPHRPFGETYGERIFQRLAMKYLVDERGQMIRNRDSQANAQRDIIELAKSSCFSGAQGGFHGLSFNLTQEILRRVVPPESPAMHLYFLLEELPEDALFGLLVWATGLGKDIRFFVVGPSVFRHRKANVLYAVNGEGKIDTRQRWKRQYDEALKSIHTQRPLSGMKIINENQRKLCAPSIMRNSITLDEIWRYVNSGHNGARYVHPRFEFFGLDRVRATPAPIRDRNVASVMLTRDPVLHFLWKKVEEQQQQQSLSLVTAVDRLCNTFRGTSSSDNDAYLKLLMEEESLAPSQAQECDTDFDGGYDVYLDYDSVLSHLGYEHEAYHRNWTRNHSFGGALHLLYRHCLPQSFFSPLRALDVKRKTDMFFWQLGIVSFQSHSA